VINIILYVKIINVLIFYMVIIHSCWLASIKTKPAACLHQANYILAAEVCFSEAHFNYTVLLIPTSYGLITYIDT
jgi:hypothetical protein